MRVRLLGTAAGGGLPQWNCNCPNCRAARHGNANVRPRTQSSVAISQDGKRWFLLNASPDLGRQIEAFPLLQPTLHRHRGTPIQGVLLTNADLDHTLGLLLLREGGSLSIHASRSTQRALTSSLGLLPAVRSFCNVTVTTVSPTPRPLRHADGSPSGLVYEAFSVPSKKPRFAAGPRGTHQLPGAVAYRITDTASAKSLIYAPEVLEVTEHVVWSLNCCDLLLFDGTFWSNQEMHSINGKTALAMGHVPISGAEGSLRKLAGVACPRKVYVHINNTNPILRNNSRESRQVRDAGWFIGEDAMEFKI